MYLKLSHNVEMLPWSGNNMNLRWFVVCAVGYIVANQSMNFFKIHNFPKIFHALWKKDEPLHKTSKEVVEFKMALPLL